MKWELFTKTIHLFTAKHWLALAQDTARIEWAEVSKDILWQ